jgi:RHS repeat-associated protein
VPGFVMPKFSNLIVVLAVSALGLGLASQPEVAVAASRPTPAAEARSSMHAGVTAVRVTKARSLPLRGRSAAEKRGAARVREQVGRAVRWPAAGSVVSSTAAPTPKRPVVLRPSTGGARVTGRVVAQEALRALGIRGVAVTLDSSGSAAAGQLAGGAGSAATRVVIDYSGFATAYGANWGGRLRATAYPRCLLTTPKVAACATGVPVASSNDTSASTITATVPLAVPSAKESSAGASLSQVVVFSAAATATDGSGDFSATPLSASSSWSSGGSSGGFSWSYPMRVPPSNGGPTPELSIAYSSQSVDGRTGATNNQAGWVGEGFSLAENYVERGYVGCDHDGNAASHDLCWKTDNATLVLNGEANQLIAVGDGTWRLSADDGARVRRLTSTSANNTDDDKEYWEVTETSGTKYYFGRSAVPEQGNANTNSVWTVPVAGNDSGEPCHQSTFSNSFCTQAWRWNLDYVVDTSGNSESYWYTAESNYYKKNGSTVVEYTPGGQLLRIDYGTRTGTTTQTPPMTVSFSTTARCLKTTSVCSGNTESDWPDTPVDQICGSSACTNVAPTFFSRVRLTSVTTNVLKAGAYEPVDSWALAQDFLASGTADDSMLWLKSIQHTGLVGGAITLPPTTFTPFELPNRVDLASYGLSPLPRYRVGTITSETGAITSVSYLPSNCSTGTLPASPETNSLRCYPQRWTPPGFDDPIDDWFNKYVVSSIATTDTTGLGQQLLTQYTYKGGAAWAYNRDKLIPDDYRTWSIWRGYGDVVTTIGDPALTTVRSQSEDYYFRGMDGDKLPSGTRSQNLVDTAGGTYPDSRELAGFKLESLTYNGAGGAVASGVITKPWSHLTAGSGVLSAHYVATAEQSSRTALSTGGFRTRVISTSYDNATGQPIRVSDNGDSSVANDETCTATAYADTQSVTEAWFVGYPARTVMSKGLCGADALAPAQTKLLSDSRIRYDNGAQGAAPTRGLVTSSDRVSGYDAGGNETYQIGKVATYDANARPLTVTKPVTVAGADVTTTTTLAYTMSNDGTLESTASVADSGGKAFLTTTVNAPEWGTATKVSDPNNRVTQGTFDALGRLTQVWLPNRGVTLSPSATYAYTVSNTAASAVVTSTLSADAATYRVSSQIYDALLRPRETQQPSPSGGRLLTATAYDTRGLAYEQAADVYAAGAPSASFVTFDEGAIPARTVTTYDGLGRPTKATFASNNADRWSTTTSYAGLDTTTVTPPNGAPSTKTTTDVRGQVVKRIELGTPALTTTTAYDLTGKVTSVSSPAGNWTYAYDLRGRRVSANDPDSGLATYTYTADDQIATVTDARNQSTLTHYDVFDRPTALYSGTTVYAANQLGAWTYDTVAKGQPASSVRYVGGSSGTGSTAFTQKVTSYDLMYHPTATSLTITKGATATLAVGLPTSVAHTTTYNIDGSILADYLPKVSSGATTVLAAEVVQHAYDSTGLPTTLQGATAIIQDTDYDVYGRPVQFTLGTGSARQLYLNYDYDTGTDRITKQLVTTNLSAQVVANHQYTYDDAGNTLADNEAVTGDKQCYSYDTHDRISSAWTPANGSCTQTSATDLLGGPAPYAQSWTYTDSGLRSTQTTLTPATSTTDSYTYPGIGAAHANLATSVSRTLAAVGGGAATVQTLAYGVDASGNTTARPDPASTTGTATTTGPGEQALTWNAEGDLDTLTQPGGGVTQYVYGLDGTLLLSSTSTTTVLYDGETQISVAKTASSNTVTAQRNYATPAGHIATRYGAGTFDISYLVANSQGTASISLDGSTLTPSRRYATPFGETRGTAVTTWPNNRGFLNAPTDTSTGLTSVGQRHYDASTGRFISPDALIDTSSPAQMLGYQYANNNPVTFSDPSGLGPAPNNDNTQTHCSTSTQVCGSKNGGTHLSPGHGDMAASGATGSKSTATSTTSGSDDLGGSEESAVVERFWQAHDAFYAANSDSSCATDPSGRTCELVTEYRQLLVAFKNAGSADQNALQKYALKEYLFDLEGGGAREDAVGNFIIETVATLGVAGIYGGLRAAGVSLLGEELGAAAAKTTPQVLKGPIADAVPKNLPQQMALDTARAGRGRQIMGPMGDAPRLVANYGEGEWVKMEYVLRGNYSNVTVHYFRNLDTGMDVEFKFP